GLELAALVAAQPLHRQAKLALLIEMMPQLLRMVAIHRDDQRSIAPVIDREPRLLLKLRHESGIVAKRLVAEADNVALLHARFGERRQHPRGRIARTTTYLAALHHGN